jgi:hypothetical protein
MDPNATLYALLEAIADGDFDALNMRAENLADWLRNGGFAPDVPATLRRYLEAN